MIRRFARWAKKEGISKLILREAIDEIESGLVDASLGGSVYKKRVPIPGKGKRGGVRTLIAYKAGEKSFFVMGFAKSEKGNVSKDDVVALREFAKELFGYNESKISQLVRAGDLEEI